MQYLELYLEYSFYLVDVFQCHLTFLIGNINILKGQDISQLDQEPLNKNKNNYEGNAIASS